MSLATNGHGDRTIEWLFSCMMIGWGAFLWLPNNTFAAPQYAPLAAIASEPVWGSFSFSIGLLRAVALAVNGRLRHTPLARCLGGAFGMLWWITMTFLFVFGSPNPPAGSAFFVIFLAFELHVVARSAADMQLSGAVERRPAPGYR